MFMKYVSQHSRLVMQCKIQLIKRQKLSYVTFDKVNKSYEDGTNAVNDFNL